MPETILFSQIPLDGGQRERLGALFVSPGYVLLKEILTAHAIKRQIQALNAGLYADTDPLPADDARKMMQRAVQYNCAIDALDDLERKHDEWFVAKLDPRR